jgi:hypothetical protein
VGDPIERGGLGGVVGGVGELPLRPGARLVAVRGERRHGVGEAEDGVGYDHGDSGSIASADAPGAAQRVAAGGCSFSAGGAGGAAAAGGGGTAGWGVAAG